MMLTWQKDTIGYRTSFYHPKLNRFFEAHVGHGNYGWSAVIYSGGLWTGERVAHYQGTHYLKDAKAFVFEWSKR